MNWINCSLAIVACLVLVLNSADAESVSYDFTQPNSLDGWQKTAEINASLANDGLHLQAMNWDAKIYRSLQLDPGTYVLYGRGSGNPHITLLHDFSTPDFAHLSLGSQEPFTDYVDFTIPAGDHRPVLLCISVPNPHDFASLQWLKIESGPPQETVATDDLPTPEELAKFKPDPPVARGFMVGGDWSEGTFRDMASWGANLVRLQFDPVQLAKKFNQPFWDAWPKVLDEIEQGVVNANKYGIKVVVDLHAPPMPEIMAKSQIDQPELWHDPDLDASFIRVWTDIATRMKAHENGIWGYDLYNEPLDRSQLPWEPKQWRPLALKLVKTIRSIDPKVWLIYEPGPGSLDRGFERLIPLPDTHVIYSVHSYDPGEFTGQGLDYVPGMDRTDVSKLLGVHYPAMIKGVYWDKARIEKSLQPAIDFQKKWHVPIYVGEFSVIRWAPKDDAVRWLQDSTELFESLGWSWSYHAFREFNGWSLENDEAYWHAGMPDPQPVNYITDRQQVIRQALSANKTGASAK